MASGGRDAAIRAVDLGTGHVIYSGKDAPACMNFFFEFSHLNLILSLCPFCLLHMSSEDVLIKRMSQRRNS